MHWRVGRSPIVHCSGCETKRRLVSMRRRDTTEYRLKTFQNRLPNAKRATRRIIRIQRLREQTLRRDLRSACRSAATADSHHINLAKSACCLCRLPIIAYHSPINAHSNPSALGAVAPLPTKRKKIKDSQRKRRYFAVFVNLHSRAILHRHASSNDRSYRPKENLRGDQIPYRSEL